MLKFCWETEFKKTEIGEIPKDWEVCPLSEVVKDAIVGSTPLKRVNKYWINGTIPWLTNKELEYGKINFVEDTEEKVNTIALEETNLKFLPPNSLIISFTASVGKVAINKVPITTNQQFIGFVIENMDTVRYIGYYFLINRELIETFSGATPFSFITKEKALQIPIILPPLPEQARIATVLSYFDDLIEVKKKQNEILEKTAMAIFKNWFIDFEPFKDEDFVYNEELGREIPKGWEVKRLGDVVEFFDHKRIPLSQIERLKRQGIYPYYGANGIIDYVDDFLFDGKFLLVPEDGIIADKDGYTISFLVNEKFWANNHIHVLKGKLTETEFLYLFLRLTPIEPYITGAVQPKLSQGNMSKIPILLPPPHILQSFHSLVEPLFQKIILNQKQIMTLRKIKDTLLPLLVFGKLRVEEI